MKKIIALLLTVIILATFALFAVGSSDDTSISTDNDTTQNTTDNNSTNATTESSTEGKQETVSQKNAVRKAKSYLDFSAFSREGLIDQLEYEGFSTEDATYGADNSGADWNEQAVKKAKSYLDFSAFSRQGLIDQLEYEGFTYEQAVYGVEQNGF